MTYVSKEIKEELYERDPQNAEELEYVIASTIADYMADKGNTSSTMLEIMGALSSAKLEFYRKILAPHKDTKEIINGHVY